ncbi:TPA: hypothetical protein RG697_003297 [Morganella morganii]|nr:hypothetical protein [Morganella morganii]
MLSKIKILWFFVILSLLVTGYGYLFKYSLGAPRVVSWWVHDTITKKKKISDSITRDKRIVIISGSNGLFGIDSKILEDKTGIPVVNFALHASLSIDFYKMIVEKNIRRGDIVIIPLEYNYYFLNDKYNDWFVDNMISWGDEYLDWLNIIDYWEFISHVDLQKIVSGSLSNFMIRNGSSYKSKLNSDDEIATYLYDGNFHGYDFRSVNNHGDIITPKENKRLVIDLINNPGKNKEVLYYMKKHKISNYGILSIASLINSIEKKGAIAVLTWPVSINSNYFNSNDNESQKMIAEISNELSNKNININCDPWSVNMPPSLFYDTSYHPNGEGAKIRTESLYSCLVDNKIITQSARH